MAGGGEPYLHVVPLGEYLPPGTRRASFFDYYPPVPGFAPPPPLTKQSRVPSRLWPILCTQFMVMARVVVGNGGSDILRC